MTENIKLNDICRFCLRVDSSQMHLLSDEVLQAFNTHFSVQILTDNYLPKQICDDCNFKMNLLFEFRKTVLKNEKILYKCLSKEHNDEKFLINFKKARFKYDDSDVDWTFEHYDYDQIKVEVKEEITSTNNSTCDLDETNIESDINETKDPKLFDKHSNDDQNNVAIFNFKCLTCYNTFETQNLLLTHYKSIHYERSTENDLKLTYSIKNVQGDDKYKCSGCSKVYNNKKAINRHIASGHRNDRPFLCKICGRTYKTAFEIVRHGRVHNGTKLFCSHQCGYSTVYRGALKEHERRHNASKFKYKCEKCEKGFHVKTWYLQHQNSHTGLKPFVCDVCGAAFHMEKYLTSHRSVKHPQSSNLKRYVCMHCSLPCDTMNALREHLKVHGITAENIFLCDLCGKILTNARQLRVHKQMHFGVKPYSCSTCNKSFAKEFNLKLHKISHTGEKLHECSLCEKRYGQRSTLLRHLARNHTDADELKSTKAAKPFPAAD